MKALISFHPVDRDFFDRLIEPLVAGEKINPEGFLASALRIRGSAARTRRFQQELERQLGLLEHPPPPQEGSLWDKVRTRLERFDHKPGALPRLVGEQIDPELHLHGRPFLITEGSADRVAALLDDYVRATGDQDVDTLALEQLVRLSPDLGRGIEVEGEADLSSEMSYRSDLLRSLKEIYDLAQTARRDENWGRAGGERLPAIEVLEDELAFRALWLHSRAHPFWIARDVDGLETICRASGVTPPDFLLSARPLFARSCEEFPGLREKMGVELIAPRGVGAYVASSDVPELLAFLNAHGSRIIQAATQAGEGPTCTVLLRKIKECATYAERHGRAYVEGCGVEPVDADVGDEDDE